MRLMLLRKIPNQKSLENPISLLGTKRANRESGEWELNQPMHHSVPAHMHLHTHTHLTSTPSAQLSLTWIKSQEPPLQQSDVSGVSTSILLSASTNPAPDGSPAAHRHRYTPGGMSTAAPMPGEWAITNAEFIIWPLQSFTWRESLHWTDLARTTTSKPR